MLCYESKDLAFTALLPIELHRMVRFVARSMLFKDATILRMAASWRQTWEIDPCFLFPGEGRRPCTQWLTAKFERVPHTPKSRASRVQSLGLWPRRREVCCHCCSLQQIRHQWWLRALHLWGQPAFVSIFRPRITRTGAQQITACFLHRPVLKCFSTII